MKKATAIISAAVALLCAGTASAYAQAGGPPPAVEEGVVTRISECGTKKYVGVVDADKTVRLTPRVSGFLLKCHFKEGEFVKEGTVMFDIEDTTYVAARNSAKAKLDQIEAELEYAKKNYERLKTLTESKAVSLSSYEDADRLYAFSKAKHEEAKAALMDAENNLSYTKITTPISGIVGRKTCSEGNYITPATGTLVTVVKISPCDVVFAMSEPDFLNLFGTTENIKKNAVVRLVTSDRNIFNELGTVTVVDNAIDTSTGTRTIEAHFPNADGQLTHGSLVDVLISKKSEDSFLAVPQSAVVLTRSGHIVYVLTPDDTAIPKPVKVGDVVGERQIILSGLQEGERIITGGTHKIMIPGTKVNPIIRQKTQKADDAAKK